MLYPPAASSWFSHIGREWQCALACGEGSAPSFVCVEEERERERDGYIYIYIVVDLKPLVAYLI